MNLRQKAKKLKIENGLMRDIIHDTDRLEQIYVDAMSKPIKSFSDVIEAVIYVGKKKQ